MKKGFTILEVLLTLGILGTIAAIVLPSVLTDTNEMAWANRKDVFEQKLDFALGKMNIENNFENRTHQEFLEELKKYMKIDKVCDAGHLDECFVSKFKYGDKDLEASSLNTGGKMGVTDDSEDTVGVRFHDGTSAILAFNHSRASDASPYSLYDGTYNKNGSKKAQRYSHGHLTDSVYMFYDINGSKGPNTTGKDIKDLNVFVCPGGSVVFSSGGALCIEKSDTNYANSIPDEETYISMKSGALASTYAGIQWYLNNLSSTYPTDNWANAKYACANKIPSMRLPTVAELVNMRADREILTSTYLLNNLTSGYYWASDEVSHNSAKFIGISNGTVYTGGRANGPNGFGLRCVR